eukprot:12701941-Ditylum_brightwellii.AAC.1
MEKTSHSQDSPTIPSSSLAPPRASLIRALESLSIKEHTKLTNMENGEISGGELGDRFSMYREESSQWQQYQQQKKRRAPRCHPIANNSTRNDTISNYHSKR